MGFLNGESSLSSSSKKGEKKDEKGKKGVGFALTADEHYHLKGKRLTNVYTKNTTYGYEKSNSFFCGSHKFY